jgi:hypothetical protein
VCCEESLLGTLTHEKPDNGTLQVINIGDSRRHFLYRLFLLEWELVLSVLRGACGCGSSSSSSSSIDLDDYVLSPHLDIDRRIVRDRLSE